MPEAPDPILELLCCPSCGGDLVQRESGLDCSRCAHAFRASDGIPQLYWPTESDGSRLDVTDQRLLVGERGEDEYGDVRKAVADLPSRLDTGSVGKTDIHDDDVRRLEPNLANGVGHCPRLPDHLDAVLGFEEPPQPLPHDLVVIDEQNPQRPVGIS